MLKTLRNALAVPFTAAGAYVAAVFSGIVDKELTTPEGLSCFVQDETARLFGETPPAPEHGVRVLVARLETDEDGRQTRHVSDSLRDAEGFEVQELCRTLSLGQGRDMSAAMKDAQDKGRRWLQDRNASILVWGQVEQEDKSVRLRLLSRDSESNDRFLALNDDLTLPKDFAPSLAVTLSASALAQALELSQGAGAGADARGSQYVADRLAPVVPKLRELAKTTASLPADQAQSLRDVYLSSLSTMWSQTGDIAYAQEAFAFSESELARLPAEDRQGRATAQYWHARALHMLGARLGEDAMIEGAIAEYRSVLTLWTRESAALDWAQAQTGLASALRASGQRKNDDKLLEEALSTYGAALEEFTRAKAPLNWARTKNSIGSTLRALGEQRQDPALLEQAIESHRAALQEATRKKAPLNWATTQSSLATALASLGDMRQDPALLQQAIAGYSNALLERRRDRQPSTWAGTQGRLADALLALGTLQGRETEIEQAIGAYRLGLEVYTQQKEPSQYADFQTRLGHALASLAAQRGDQALYGEAITAYESALSVYETGAAPEGVTALRSSLEAAQAKLAALKAAGNT
jgi:hypothetical protein